MTADLAGACAAAIRRWRPRHPRTGLGACTTSTFAIGNRHHLPRTDAHRRAHAQIAAPAAGYRTRTGNGHLHAGALSRALPTRTGSAEGVRRMIWKLGRCYLGNKGTDDLEVRALLCRRIRSCFPSKRLPPRPRPPLRASTDRPLVAPTHRDTSASRRAGVAIHEREPTRAAASANMSARSEYASTGTHRGMALARRYWSFVAISADSRWLAAATLAGVCPSAARHPLRHGISPHAAR